MLQILEKKKNQRQPKKAHSSTESEFLLTLDYQMGTARFAKHWDKSWKKMKYATSVSMICHLSPDNLQQDIQYPFPSIQPQVLDKFSFSYHHSKERDES